MSKKKYTRKADGSVRGINTSTLNLEKPLGNENYDINIFNSNMDKIDKAIKKVEIDLSNIELTAERVEYNKNECVNVDGALDKLFQADLKNKASILELRKIDGELSNLQTTDKTNLVAAINEVFQNANNGKDIIANAIGTPLVNSDTFSVMGTKIDTLTQTFQSTLVKKGIEVLPNDKMSALISKVALLKKICLLPYQKDTFKIEVVPHKFKAPKGSDFISTYNDFVVLPEYKTSSIYILNLVSGETSKMTSNLNRWYTSGGIVNNVFYRQGGWTLSNEESPQNEIFDLKLNTVTYGATKVISYKNSSVTSSTKIYHVKNKEMNIFDTITGSWTYKKLQYGSATSPGVALTSHENKIYQILKSSNSFAMYDIQTGTETLLEPSPVFAGNNTCMFSRGKFIFAVLTDNSFYKYDVENNTWELFDDNYGAFLEPNTYEATNCEYNEKYDAIFKMGNPYALSVSII